MSLDVAPTQMVTYDVSGSTLEEAADNVGLPGGEAGLTEFGIGYEYDGVRRGLPRNLVVHLSITITMPRWLDRDGATGPEQDEWDRFHAALLAHEQEHASRMRSGARRVHARLLRTRAAELEQRFQSGKRMIQRESDAFDDATHHGQVPAPGTVITFP